MTWIGPQWVGEGLGARRQESLGYVTRMESGSMEPRGHPQAPLQPLPLHELLLAMALKTESPQEVTSVESFDFFYRKKGTLFSQGLFPSAAWPDTQHP